MSPTDWVEPGTAGAGFAPRMLPPPDWVTPEAPDPKLRRSSKAAPRIAAWGAAAPSCPVR